MTENRTEDCLFRRDGSLVHNSCITEKRCKRDRNGIIIANECLFDSIERRKNCDFYEVRGRP